MFDRAAARGALIGQLEPRSCKPVDETIPDQTDIYRELNINGQDLWEVFAWMSETYGTDCSAVKSTDYDINEPPSGWFDKWSFKRVTVGEILDAIERGRWIVPT